MKTCSTDAFEANRPLEIVELDLEGPKVGKVLKEFMATNVRGADSYAPSGLGSEGLFPSVLGYEGAGILHEFGVGATSVAPIDRFISPYPPERRQCLSCLSGMTNLCTAIRSTHGKEVMPNGTIRLSNNGRPISHHIGGSTIANCTVLSEIAVAKIRTEPLGYDHGYYFVSTFTADHPRWHAARLA